MPASRPLLLATRSVPLLGPRKQLDFKDLRFCWEEESYNFTIWGGAIRFRGLLREIVGVRGTNTCFEISVGAKRTMSWRVKLTSEDKALIAAVLPPPTSKKTGSCLSVWCKLARAERMRRWRGGGCRMKMECLGLRAWILLRLSPNLKYESVRHVEFDKEEIMNLNDRSRNFFVRESRQVHVSKRSSQQSE